MGEPTDIMNKIGREKGCTPWNKGKKTGMVPRSAFKEGFTPWNKGTKGITKSWNKGKVGAYSEEAIEKMSLARKGKPSWNKGVKMSEEQKKKISLTREGQPAHNKGQVGVFHHSSETRKLLKKIAHRGEENNNWKGGVTPENHRIRTSAEYKDWRKSVFERDNHTCQKCGARNGNGKKIILNADHIKPFALHPELRFSIDNGRALCVDCHKETETWGFSRIYMTKEQQYASN